MNETKNTEPEKAKEVPAPKAEEVSSADDSFMLTKYRMALDLYKHEDNLNWKKLSNLLYINAALFAVLGFLIEEKDSAGTLISMDKVLLGVTVVGILASSVLWASLSNGVKFLQKRKKAAIKIEKQLNKQEPPPELKVICMDSDSGRFTTANFLRFGPALFVAIWLLVGFGLIFM